MTLLSIALAAVATGLFAYRLTKFLSWKLNHLGVTGVDVHKLDKPLRAEMGGLAVLSALPLGSAILLTSGTSLTILFAAGLTTVGLSGVIGAIDDFYGIRQRYKPLLIAAASLPVAISLANRTSISFPIVGPISLGIVYPLLIVPLAVTTSANFSNMLAGFNGLEGGLGAIAIGALALLSAAKGKWEAAFLGVLLLAAYLGFLKHNWYPARIFPGDTGTLMSGAGIATLGLIGGLEFSAIMVSMPAALDFTLKTLSKRPFSHRGRFGDSRIKLDGKLEPPSYPALAHAFLKLVPLAERDLVLSLLLMEFVYAALAVVLTLTL